MISNSHKKRLAREHAAAEAQRTLRVNEGNITAFRREELHWKSRTVPVNLAQAVSAETAGQFLDVESIRDARQSWTDRNGRAWPVRLLSLEGSRRLAILFDDLPGRLNASWRLSTY